MEAIIGKASRNPYHSSDSVPQLRHSVLAFIDILGYTEMTARSERDGKHQQLLSALYKSLSEARRALEGKYEQSVDLPTIGPHDRFALKAFTDNIVVGWPIRDDAEIELGDAFSKLAFFQFQMAMDGFFLRGAISIGDAFVDDIAVYGAALNEAFLGESRQARDPRIVLTESAQSAVIRHLRYYGNKRYAPQARDVLRDSDGQMFLNYLDSVLIAEQDAGPFYAEFLRHKSSVEQKLDEFKNEPNIFSKYLWVARYHNYFCDLHKEYFADEHRIDLARFVISPQLIVE